MRNGNQGVIEMSYIEKFWRDATAADVARALAGEKVEARFRDSEIHVWTSVGRRLIGARAVEGPEISLRWLDRASCWHYCQVYDPPQWFLDKPDPGEGYRLLAKFPDEALQPGDDALGVDGIWSTSYQVKSFGVQVEEVWYRRRIEQPKPEPKHYSLQVGDTVETPSGHLIKIVDRPTEQMHYTLQVGDTCDAPSGHRLAVTEHGVEVT